jgi:hypothetical protein
MGLTIQAVSKKEHVHDGRVIVQRGGARSGSRRWKMQNDQHLNWIPESGVTSNGTERQLMRAEKQFMRNMNKAYYYSFHIEVIFFSSFRSPMIGRKLGKAR